jgi:putative sugar O-methyltransferase
MHEAAQAFRTATEAVRYAQLKIGFDHRLIAGKAIQHFALCAKELATEFPAFADKIGLFHDSELSDPNTTFYISGQLVSNITLYHAHIILSCLSRIRAPQTVIELGGGYGAPARAWLLNPVSPISTYIIIDIPESLFFSQTFLSVEFGADAVHYLHEDALDPAVLDQARVVLCPIHNIKALSQIQADVVINTGSLQEMTDEWITFYMDWLDLQPARYFYSQNYLGQPVGFLAESMNVWSPRPSPAWTARSLRVNSAFIRMQADRNYLEAVYERAPARLSKAEAMTRLKILSERLMTTELLSEYLDLFRRTQNVDVAKTTLTRAMTEMPVYPKEALYLADWLTANASPHKKTAEWFSLLTSEREAGVEGTT